MKSFLVKLVVFFKKEHIWKYLVQAVLFMLAFCVFLFFVAGDVISNVVSVVVGFLFSTMLLYFCKVIYARFEDFLKVSCDTEYILNIYDGDPSYRKTLTLGDTVHTFAYADTLVNDGYEFEVVDEPNKMFELDDFVMNNYFSIFVAHSNSVKSNGLTVRLDDVRVQDGKCTLYLSRSTVFNHLVTNRAIDYAFFENLSLRDVYEYGPTISPYADSKMSNHIGINGLVFLSDGRLLVPQRNAVATISKNQITSSIAVKLDFPKTGERYITTEYLLKQNIMENLTARTKLPASSLDPERIDIEFLGFGQNLYEAGKPQFYYVVHLRDVDTARYFELKKQTQVTGKIDVDKCIHVADYESFRFKGEAITMLVHTEQGRTKRLTVQYEQSFLCNLWHYEQQKSRGCCAQVCGEEQARTEATPV